MSLDGNRILMRLSQTPQLPILCLHNTPAMLISLTSFCHSLNVNIEHKTSQLNLHLPSVSSFTSKINAFFFLIFIYLGDFTEDNSNSKNKTLSSHLNDDRGIRSDSVLSVKSKNYIKKSGNKLFDKEEIKRINTASNISNNNEVNTSKKLKTDSAINNSIIKNITNPFNRKSNICLIL